jgi:hypothetical protein
MSYINKKAKLIAVAALMAGGLVIDPSAILVTNAEAKIARPECIYSSSKIPILGCMGKTTSLCKGSSDCPTKQIR